MAASSPSPTTLALPPSTQPAQVVAAFISKVWSILANDDYKQLISWSESGKNVIVHDYPNFSKEILPRYFKHNNFNSFVRQLNLYGFRKVSHLEQGVLSKVLVNEPIEFWHQHFSRGHPEALHLVQRRPVPSRVGPEEKGSDLGKVLSDIHVMKGKQENIGDMLEVMRQDNAHLKRELEMLRQRHTRQQRVLNKIIQFLIHMVYKGRLPPGGGRRRHDSRYLMLTDSESAAPPPKRGRVSLDPSSPSFPYPDSPLGFPDFSKLPIKASGEVAPIDSLVSPLSMPTVTSPPPSPNMSTLAADSTPTNSQPALEPTTPSVPSSLPPSDFTAHALITSPSLPSSLSPSPITSLLPALPDPSSLDTTDPSSGSLAAPSVFPDWAHLTDHLDCHQQELDSLPDFLSNQLSFDPTLLNQFISLGDPSVPDYDAITTARLLEALSEEDAGEAAVLREKSPQTALVPLSKAEAPISVPGVFLSQALNEEDEPSSSLRELLELNKDTDT